MLNLYKTLNDIVIEFNNKIKLQKTEINNEREKINNDINRFINLNPNLIKLSALNTNVIQNANVIQNGGLKLKLGEGGIDTLDKLNELFAKLQSINPQKIEQQNEILQEKTKEILNLLKTVTSEDYTKKKYR